MTTSTIALNGNGNSEPDNTTDNTTVEASVTISENGIEATTEPTTEPIKIKSAADLQASQLSHQTTSDYIGCFISWSIDESMLVSHDELKGAVAACDINPRFMPSQKTPDQAFASAVNRWNSSSSGNKPNGWRLGMIPQRDVPQSLREKGYKMAALTSASNVKDDQLIVKLGKAQSLTLAFLYDRETEKTYFSVEGRKDEDWGKKGQAICGELEYLYDEAFMHDRHAIHTMINRFVSYRGLTVNNRGSGNSLIFIPGKWLSECKAMESLVSIISKYTVDGYPLSNITLIPQYTLTDLGAITKQITDQIIEEINRLKEEAVEFNSDIPEMKSNGGEFSASVEKKISDFGERRNRLAGYTAKFPVLQTEIEALDKVLEEIAATYDALVQIITMQAQKQNMTINRKVGSARSRLFADV